MECRLCGNIVDDNALFGVCFEDIETLTTGAVKDKQRADAKAKEDAAATATVEAVPVVEEETKSE